MDFSETIPPNRPNSQMVEIMRKMSIAEVMPLVLGYTTDQLKEIRITQYSSADEYDAHMATQIAKSDVKNCKKWAEMHEFANDLTDTNLETTIFDNIKDYLSINLRLISAYIRQFKINEVGPNDNLVFYAFNDQDKQPDFNLYQLFLINEISRSVEKQRNVFSGIGGEAFMIVILNNLEQNIKNKLTKECFNFVSNLQCGLTVVAKSNLQTWNGETWLSDNGE